MNQDNFRKITPYVPGIQPGFSDMIKLNTNENPYPPSPMVGEASKNFDAGSLRLYPSVDVGPLRDALAEYHGYDRECMFIGVGSDDVLATVFQACFNSGRPVLFPEITYSFYEVWARLYNINTCKIPLKEDFTIDADAYIGVDNGGIVIANPNAPTSVAMAKSEIERIIKNNTDNVVVIDEAYVDFGGESVIDLVKSYDNLIVVRTFSKSRSLAGARIGYCVANPALISVIEAVRNSINSYTDNRPAIELGVASVKDEDYFRATIKKVVATRERLADELKKLGFRVLPSSANFVFAQPPAGISAVEVYEELAKKHIYVRHFNIKGIDNYLRITVGTDEQIDTMLSEVGRLLNK
ncbi:MAG: histidinol-phosphate transaminase [Lachnospiraceae bacterium]|nr:histidinol-phosphate transaminase [Lachnospiraceae bacterium]